MCLERTVINFGIGLATAGLAGVVLTRECKYLVNITVVFDSSPDSYSPRNDLDCEPHFTFRVNLRFSCSRIVRDLIECCAQRLLLCDEIVGGLSYVPVATARQEQSIRLRLLSTAVSIYKKSIPDTRYVFFSFSWKGCFRFEEFT